jgi:hypothetical protein
MIPLYLVLPTEFRFNRSVVWVSYSAEGADLKLLNPLEDKI